MILSIHKLIQTVAYSSLFLMVGFYSQVEHTAPIMLSPDSPSSYLEAAELELAQVDSDIELLRALLVRGVFWGAQTDDHRTASSACFLLADMEADLSDSQWLWDLGLVIDPSRMPEWLSRGRRLSTGESQVEIDAALCMYSVRYHQHPLATELWARSEVREEIFLAGERAGVQRAELLRVLNTELENGSQDACRGRLFVADRANPGKRIACPDHLRGLGMCSNDDDLAILLRVEVVLNQVRFKSWSAAVSMSIDQPVILPSIDELLIKYNVDPSLGFYRDGQWVAAP